jgi:hypothetical protein
MNEENAVLEFFVKPENLPLGLSVAAQINATCERMNAQFWTDLKQRIDAQLASPAWQIQVTEDRNSADILVGLQYNLCEPQANCLFPMLEQQYLGGDWRIYFGLMWQNAPNPGQLALPEVTHLKQVLADAGLKSNENFLAWQWTKLYPRRRDFLLRYANQTEKLLDEIESILKTLPLDLIAQANVALQAIPVSHAISLEQLRNKRSE